MKHNPFVTYRENVELFRIRDRFVYRGRSLYSFIEPFLLGNSELHALKGFKPFFMPEKALPRFSLKRFILRADIIDASVRGALLLCALRNSSRRRKRMPHTDILLFSNRRFIQSDGKNPFFDSIAEKLSEDLRCTRICFDVKDPFTHAPGYRSIYSCLDLSVFRKIMRVRDEVASILNAALADHVLRDIFSMEYCHPSGKRMTYYEFLYPQIVFFFKILPLTIAVTLVLTEELLVRSKARAVLAVSEAELFTKGMILAADTQNVKTFTMQFGPILEHFCDINPSNDIIPTTKFVEGVIPAEILIRVYKYPRRHLSISGAPRYDILRSSYDVSSLQNALRLSPQRKVLLYVDEGRIDGIEKVCALLDEVQKKYGLHVLIKPHPTASQFTRPFYEQCAKRNASIALCSGVAHHILRVSDVVVTGASTVAFEAVLLHKPLVLLNLDHSVHGELPFAQEGSALRAQTKEEFFRAIHALLHNKTVRTKLHARQDVSIRLHAYRADGKSSERVARRIRAMV